MPRLISVVIPVYNEASLLPMLCEQVIAALKNLDTDYELILVDDGSSDPTWIEILRQVQKWPALKGVSFSRNFGKDAALLAGIDEAKGDLVITMDGDLQHPPAVISELYAEWKRTSSSVVEAVKESRPQNESWLNRIGAIFYYAILNRLAGMQLNNHTDFKLLDRKAIDALKKLPERNFFYRGMTRWIGLSVSQVIFTVALRPGGRSKWNFFRLLRLSINSLSSFTSFPLQLVTSVGFFFFIFSFVLAIQTLYMKFTGQSVSGFTTVILLQLIVGSVLMISLGIIGIYLAKIYEEIKQRPRYIIGRRSH